MKRWNPYRDAQRFCKPWNASAIESFTVEHYAGDGYSSPAYFNVHENGYEKNVFGRGATLEEALRDFSEKIRNNPKVHNVESA